MREPQSGVREGISIPLPTPPLDSPYPPLNDQGTALDPL